MNATADEIRASAGRRLEAARRQGLAVATIVAKDLVYELDIKNGTPAVCQVLGGKKLQREYHVILEQRKGPPSGQSTTMEYTYRLSDKHSKAPGAVTLWGMKGAWRGLFEAAGGIEAVIAETIAARTDSRDLEE